MCHVIGIEPLSDLAVCQFKPSQTRWMAVEWKSSSGSSPQRKGATHRIGARRSRATLKKSFNASLTPRVQIFNMTRSLA